MKGTKMDNFAEIFTTAASVLFATLAAIKGKELIRLLRTRSILKKALILNNKLTKSLTNKKQKPKSSEPDVDLEKIQEEYDEIRTVLNKLHKTSETKKTDYSIEIEKYKRTRETIWDTILSPELIMTKEHERDNDEEGNKKTVIGLIIGDHMSRDKKSYTYIALGAASHAIAATLGIIDLNLYVIGFFISLASLLMLNQKSLEFRVKNGFYGSTAYEAREIINYIENHSNPDDFNDGGRRKKIFETGRKQHEHGITNEGGAFQ